MIIDRDPCDETSHDTSHPLDADGFEAELIRRAQAQASHAVVTRNRELRELMSFEAQAQSDRTAGFGPWSFRTPAASSPFSHLDDRADRRAEAQAFRS